MATIGQTALTLSDYGKRLDPDGSIARLIELLKQKNEVLEEMPFLEGNLPTGHKTTVRSGLPATTWRLLNYGVQPSKSRSVPVTDTTGMLEAYSEVDKELADLNGNTAAFRLSEDIAFIESMNINLASTLFYGNTATNPERFMGLAPRFSDTTAENGSNIFLAGGAGSTNTSIWLIAWGDNTCHGIYPKGSQAGLKVEDLGQETLTDAAGGLYEGYRSHYIWKAGLTVRDWRYVVRVANIDVTALTKDGSGSSADLIDLMAQALEQIEDTNTGKLAFYCNRTVKSFLRRQISNKANVNLTLDNSGGKPVMMFDEVPVRMTDAILSTEEAIS
jgi:hypothetical protein